MLFGKHVNEYYLKYGIFLLIGIVALLVVDYFQLLIPEIVGNIIDKLEIKELTQIQLKEYVLQLGVIALVMFAGRFLWRLTLFGTGIKIECDLRNKVFKNMQTLSQSFFSKNKTGSLMAIYTNDLAIIRETFGLGTIMLVDAIALGTMALIKMFTLNALLSIISLACLVVVSVISSLVGKKITKATENNYKVYGELSDYVQEDYSGISVIKAFVKEKIKVKLFAKYNTENMNSTLVMTKLSLKLNVFITALLSLVNILIIFYGGYLIYQLSIGNDISAFTIGDLTKFSAYFGTLIWPIEAVGRLIDLRSKGKASLNRVNKLIDEQKEINDDLVDENTIDIKEIFGNIEYRDLSFNYPENDDENTKNAEVLSHVNIKINQGEFVGMIGETGSGKSTIVDVLLRLYNIEENKVFIDGHDLMHLPIKVIRDNIAYDPQDNFLFSEKITNNIAFSETETINNEKIIKSAELSDVKNDIEDFSLGFETVLGERGVTVSGGQKQRIAIARALYKDANILILDDSLSAVDTETEKEIINNLRSLRKDKTTIIIAHRITTLQNLDKILVIENGTCTACGTHNELLKTSEAYEREVRLQELEKETKAENVGDNNE